ncbi:MAG TPA: DinB family protein [Chloroflexota bacterium]
MTTTTSALEAIQQLTRERERIVHELSGLGEAELARPAQWGGMQRNVNFLLRAYSLHELDHLQQMHKLLAAHGRRFSEAQVLLSKAAALRGEVAALLLGLSDEEFNAPGPDGEWSIRELVQHLTEVDQTYLGSIRAATATA